MRVLGIDPSFTRTGIAIIGDSGILALHSIQATDGDIYAINKTMLFSHEIARLVAILLDQYKPDYVIVEYPVLSTPSGAYLGLIQQALYEQFCIRKLKVCLVPSTAVNGYTKAVSKPQLVNWVITHPIWKAKRRPNHDAATGFVLCCILMRILNNTYDKKYRWLSYDQPQESSLK